MKLPKTRHIKAELRGVERPTRSTTRNITGRTVFHVLLSTVFLAGPLCAADSEQKSGTWSLYFENDLFAGTDRYYTNGVKLSWSSPDLENPRESRYSHVLLPVFNLLPGINESEYQKNLVFTLGQNIYTPNNTATPLLVPNDRPYAGWLYLGTGVVWKNTEVRNTLLLNLGVVGPWSFAKETQRFVHEVRGIDKPQGWDNQLHNELGTVLVYERMWRWPNHKRRSGLDWEALPHAGAAVGNVQTFANAGGEVRLGLNLPDDFGTTSIGQATTTSTPVDGRMAAQRSRFDFGLYAFARADGRAIARNVFLDGNTFGQSHSVGHKPFVADLSAGVSFNHKNTKIAYAFVYRTREFDAQKDAQIFGTLSINWAF